MGKYISSIKDLVILVMTNGSQVIFKANSGDPESCFQVGMMHLLGINTPVDFKKASHYLSNQSLVGNQDATLLLAFIAECEGDFSKAFRQYANTISSETDAYIDKVIKGRKNLQDFLMKQNLPISLNKEISSILSNYGKGKSSRTGACTKIAAICNDEPTCLEVGKCLYDAKDYISAIDWLKRGNVEPNDSMFITINKKLKESTLGLLNSKDLQVINLENISLLSKEDPTPFFKKVKDTCHEASMKCSEEWKDINKSFIDKLIKEQKNQEYLASLAAEEEAKRKKRTRNLLIGIAIIIILGILVMLTPSSSDKETETKEVTSEKTEEINSTDSNNAEEDICSEEYLLQYLKEIIPVAMKMNEEKAVKKYFSKEFYSLYHKVDEYDKKHLAAGDFEIGFWDFEFWTGGQGGNGELHDVSVLKISDFSNKKATAIIQFAYKSGEYDEFKESVDLKMVFENEKWLIDDFHSYKFRFGEYLKEVGINTSSVNNNQNSNSLINILSERRLSEADLAGLSKKELEIMRNSIYACYGYKFKREDLLDYFSQYSWYTPTTSDMGAIYNMMNDNEKFNVDFIKKHE